MGGFVLIGKKYVFTKIYPNDDYDDCMCFGLRMKISSNLENLLSKDTKISRSDFFSIIKTDYHIGDEKIFYYVKELRISGVNDFIPDVY